MGRRRHLEPFECEILTLGPKGTGVGIAPDGRPIHVRGAPPGGRVAVAPAGLRKGIWRGRRRALIRPPAEGTAPPCPQFGSCGGCTLQELSLQAQRRHKQAAALRAVADGLGSLDGVQIHGVRGDVEGYRYRNKVELSFGVRRWLPEAAHGEGLSIEGRFLGFHAPGRFDRVVDAPGCLLISEAMERILATVRAVALSPEAPPPHDVRTHQGFWRHLLLREAADGCLAVAYTTSGTPQAAAWMARLAEALEPLVVGLEWRINDEVADVARGKPIQAWGRPWLEERLGPIVVRVSPSSFLQTNTRGCVILYDTIAEALGSAPGTPEASGTLLDLYCGAGSIGLYLADRFEQIVGLEERAEAVADAEANAAHNGVTARFEAVRVEDALAILQPGADVHVVVDPPRAGLHPRVARALAGIEVGSLVYVACNPASLGRDAAILRAGGWRLTDLWTVDLFPQTGHIELVGRFSR